MGSSRGPAPDPASVTGRPEFAERLLDLMRWAGRSHREVAQRSGRDGDRIAPGTATNLTMGSRAPVERSVVGFLHGCGLPREQHQPWIDKFRELYPRSPYAAPPQPTGPPAGPPAGPPRLLRDLVRPFPEQHEALSTLWARAGGAAGHAERLIGILDRLLAPWICDVAPAEAALLLLAARHHDRGEGLGAYLHRLPDGLLAWQGVPLVRPLLAVCRAVDRPVVRLRDPELDAVPGLDADLRFCAVLLRIAELLDVSDDRPPAAVREHLGLAASGRSPRGRINVKDLAFPEDRPPGYAVSLLARPDHPSAEHDLRQYLATVDRELLQYQAIRLDPHPRWPGLALPGETAGLIYPTGYKYGEFRFELDRAAVLELFMGEQLYDDPHVFLRELLQNAFDAVRLRHYLHGPDPAHRVAVTCWRDETGYLWLRVDDPGIGMDEQALRAYFLRVGRSYYRSPEFAAELVERGRDAAGFTPISRFGIGVLSCFMVADAVEVSTRRLYGDGSPGTPLRLSLRRDEDFFVLREAEMPAGPMPARSPADAEEYRADCGTSIAVRIDPLRARVMPETVAETVDRYLFCPPVPVTLNDAPAGRIDGDLVERPWVDGVHVAEIPVGARLPIKGQRYYSSDEERLPYRGPLRITTIALDLTKHSATPMLRGQLIGCRVGTGAEPEVSDLLVGLDIQRGDPKLAAAREVLRRAVTKMEFHTSWRTRNDGSRCLEVYVARTLDPARAEEAIEILEPGLVERLDTTDWSPRTKPGPTYGRARVVVTRQLLLDELTGSRAGNRRNHEYRPSSRFDVPWEALRADCGPAQLPDPATWLGHNGIAVPSALTERARTHTMEDELKLLTGNETVCGLVALADSLRPDVSVSRSQLRYVPFAVHSALHLAVRRAAATLRGGPFEDFAEKMTEALLIAVPPAGRFAADALRDPLVDGGAWDEERVIRWGKSIAGLRRALLDGDEQAEVFHEPVVSWIDDAGEYDAYPLEFDSIIQNALLHARLRLAVPPGPGDDDEDEDEWHDGDDVLVVTGAGPERRSLGADRFPPLMFVPYLDGPAPIRRGYGPWNLRHPVVAWIVEHADELIADLPAAYDRIRGALELPVRRRFDEPGPEPSAEEELDEALAMIRRLRPDLGPPPL